MSEKNDVIASIRNRFKYNFFKKEGITFSTEGGVPGFNACREFIRNFSKIDHFVIELIQNAEDCNSKSFELVIEKDRIIAINDGEPFSESNVRSLCSFGEGTKKDKPNYIGFFGAGFKSVFKITDNPKIFSGDYSFQFDSNTFFIPTTISEKNPYPSKGTTVVLPFKQDLSNDKITDIEKQIFNLKPEIILFLRNLEKIHIVNKVNSQETIFHKKYTDKIIELYNKQAHCGNWVVYEGKFSIPSSALNSLEKDEKEKRQKAKIRSVTLAFKLDKDYTFDANIGANKLFAFLPSKYETNLNFLINSDFITTAGREHLYEDSEWNKWLFECAGTVLIDAIKDFKKNNTLKYIFYEILPKRYEIKEKQLVLRLYAILEKYCYEEKIALTIDEEWANITDVVFLDYDLKGILDILSNKEFNKLTGKHFIHPNIKGKEFLDGFGLDSLSFDKFLEYFKDKNWFQNKGEEWFLNLYTFLFNKYREGIHEKIKDLQIIKLEDGDVKSINQIKTDYTSKSIYYPLEKLEVDDEISDLFDGEIGVLNKKLYELYKKKYSNLKTFFRFSLQNVIKDLDLNTIIIDFVLAKFEEAKDSNKKRLIELTNYIRKKSASLQEDVKDKIKEKIKLRTKSGNWLVPEDTYISGAYSDIDIFDLIQNEIGFDVVSEDYLDVLKDKSKWFDFFRDLNVNLYFKCEKKDRFYNGIDHGHDDVDCKIIRKLFNLFQQIDNKKKLLISKKLFQNFDLNWDHYKLKLQEEKDIPIPKGGCIDHYEKKVFPTEFLDLLRHRKWLPSINGELYLPEEIYLDTKEVKEYDANLPRLDVGYDVKNKEIISSLGINERLDANAYIEDLKSLREKGKIDLMRCENLYCNIAKSLSNLTNKSKIDEIIRRFEEEKLIYLPILSGKEFQWVSPIHCFLNHNKLIKDYICGLRNIYPEKGTEKLFESLLCIREKPKIQDYLNVLKILKNIKLTENNRVDIVEIYIQINNELENNDLDSLDWWDDFANGEYLLSQRDNFLAKEKIILDDNYNYGSYFEKEVDFLYLPDERIKPRISKLLENLNLKKLSSEIKTQLNKVEVVDKADLSDKVSPIELYDKAIKIYISKKHSTQIFDNKSLNLLKIAFVKELQVKYTLNRVAKDVTLNAFFDKEVIYLKDKGSNNIKKYKEELSKGIAEYFELPIISEHLFKLIQLCIIDNEDIYEFYKKEGIKLSKNEFKIEKSIEEEPPEEKPIIKQKFSTDFTKDIERESKKEKIDFVDEPDEEGKNKEESVEVKKTPEPKEDYNKLLELIKKKEEEIKKHKVKEEELSNKEEEIEQRKAELKKEHENIQKEKRQIDHDKKEILAQERKGRTESPTKRTSFMDEIKRRIGIKAVVPDTLGVGITNPEEPYSLEEKEEIESKFRGELEQEIKENQDKNKRRGYKQVLESIGDKEIVNDEVSSYYNGECQICGWTFKQKGGKNYCEIVDILPKRFKGARFVGNKLCLCPNHAAIVKHGKVDYELDNLKTNKLNVVINGKKETIKFNPSHFIAFEVMFRKK